MEMKFFRRTIGYTFFLPQKEWNFGRAESSTSWQETKKIQIEMATTCNKNEQKQNAKNKVELWIKWKQLGRPLKKLLDKAEADLLRPNMWQMMMMLMIYSYVILLPKCTADDCCVLNLLITCTKCNIYNALIKNSLLYGSETWRLRK